MWIYTNIQIKDPAKEGFPLFNYFSTLYRILIFPHQAEAFVWNISPIYNQWKVQWFGYLQNTLTSHSFRAWCLCWRRGTLRSWCWCWPATSTSPLTSTSPSPTSSQPRTSNVSTTFGGFLLNVLVLGFFGDFGYMRPFSHHNNRDFLGSQCSVFEKTYPCSMSSGKLVEVNFAFGRTMFPAWKLFCRCGMSWGGSRDWPFQSKQGQFPLNANTSHKCILATIRGLVCTNLKADWPSCIKRKHGQYLSGEEYQELDLFRPSSAHKNEQIAKKIAIKSTSWSSLSKTEPTMTKKFFSPPPRQFPIWIGSQTKGKSQPDSFPLVYIQVQSPPRPNSWLTSSSSP